jgi:hypothetical protein
MVEISVEHILMFVIVAFLLYHLVGRCGCTKDGFSVGGEDFDRLVYDGSHTTADDFDKLVYDGSHTTADIYDICYKKELTPYGKCAEIFAYNSEEKQMEGCVVVDRHNSADFYGCDPVYRKDKNLIHSNGICSDNNSCPSCISPMYYSMIVGTDNIKCNKSLQACQKCKNASNIKWSSNISGGRDGPNGEDLGYWYEGKNPLLNCDISESIFCEQNKTDCFDNLKKRVDNDIKNASNTDCSNKAILKSIENGSYTISECKYDGVSVNSSDEWLKEYLDNDNYCEPTNTEWKCKRDLPKYCKKGTCSYDGVKCDCKYPNVLLNTGECGIPTCGTKASDRGSSKDTCPQGKGTCHSEVIPAPLGKDTTIWICK